MAADDNPLLDVRDIALRFGGIVVGMQRANVGLLDEDVGSITERPLIAWWKYGDSKRAGVK